MSTSKPPLKPLNKSVLKPPTSSQSSELKPKPEPKSIPSPSTPSFKVPDISKLSFKKSPKSESSNSKPTKSDSTNSKSSNSKSSPERKTRPPHSKPVFKQVLNLTPPPTSNSKGLGKASLGGDYDHTDINYDDVDTPIKNSQIPGLSAILLPHQVKGVKFMVHREREGKYTSGGILADDMGLGKTIQTISLLLCNPPPPNSTSKTTLVVLPLALLKQWADEINLMAPQLKVASFYKNNRDKLMSTMMDYDVIITSYQTVCADTKNRLFQFNWYRIVCDEAHVIRNPATVTFTKISQLKADKKWALTGTPIHNSINDMVSLLRYLDVEPFNDTRNNSDPQLVSQVLPKLLLRRTQNILQNLLPECIFEKVNVPLSKKEMNRYTTESTNPLTMLLRKRQHCLGIIRLLEKAQKKDAKGKAKDAKTKDEDEDEEDKDEDKDKDKDKDEDEHKHKHKQKEKEKGTRRRISIEDMDSMDDGGMAKLLGSLSLKPETKPDHYLGHDSTRFNAVKTILNKDRQRKTIIFSSFVTALKLLQPMLESEGFEFSQYDGQLSSTARERILKDFKDPQGKATVLLCSLQATAVGLNLTAASQVIMLDPWWNPQIVSQAIKRVHRIGQTRTVHCFELYAKNTVEERMLILQERKKKLANDFVLDSDELSKDDAKFLANDD